MCDRLPFSRYRHLSLIGELSTVARRNAPFRDCSGLALYLLIRMFRPFTTEWADAFRAAINADVEYAAVAKSWKWPVAFVLDATPAYGYPNAVAVQLVLDRGTCSSAVIMPPHTVSATFVLRADYGTWKEVVKDGLDPINAVTSGRIKFTGPLGTLLMHAKAAVALVNSARAVPTLFPDDTE